MQTADTSGLRIHAICLALNEIAFIENQLRTLYPFCSGISVITQFDRDWYGEPVVPDGTAEAVLRFPDPQGKIHLSVRRGQDEAAARNSEMLFFGRRATSRIKQSHSRRLAETKAFYGAPDYFLIVDADELYDVETLPRILKYLAERRPRGMRVWGYNYALTWNRRCPREVVPFCHFGFVRPGVLFEHRRTVSWNESRMRKALGLLKLPDISRRLWGFITCPEEVGVFHHGCWIGGDKRMQLKARVSSHKLEAGMATPETISDSLSRLETVFVPTAKLPRNIREAAWPGSYLEA
jgi:hypothetical protein